MQDIKLLISDDDLYFLFPDDLERKVFKEMMIRLLEFIDSRTSIHGYQINLD